MMYEERKKGGVGDLEELVVKSPYPDIEIPEKTFTQLIWERHGQWEHQIAVECGLTGVGYTYSTLLRRAETIGQSLLNEGLLEQDVFAFLLINTPDYVATILGAARVGLTIASINPLYTPDEIAYHLKNSGAKSILTYPGKVQDVLKAVRKLTSCGVLSNDFQIICADVLNGEKVQLPPEVRSLADVIRKGSSMRCPKEPASTFLNKKLAFISNSSGTTGLPKGVCLTHKNVTASILQMAHKETTIFKETTSSYQDVLIMVLPIFHNFGLEIILDALYHGSKIITLPKFDENTFLNTLKNSKATMLFVVPPMVHFLGLKPEVTNDHLKYLRLIMSAAAPLGEDDILRCIKKAPCGVNFIQGYGQTEAMCLLTQVPYGVKNYKSIGIPLVNTKMKVIDTDNGSSKPEYKKGEICFKGPQTSLGYLNNQKATQEMIDCDGWYHTGDIGYYDSKGYFYIVDRLKEMIKVKGYQVAPAELESVLRSHPGVEDVGVTGMKDERKGEVPVGFVKPKPLFNLSDQHLKDFLSEKVAPFKMINKFIFVDSIPKSPSGKILRRELKQLLDR